MASHRMPLQPEPRSLKLVNIERLTKKPQEPQASPPLDPKTQELEVMEARLRDLKSIFEYLHSFHSWVSHSANSLAQDVQDFDPRVQGRVYPVNIFDTLTPKVHPGFLIPQASGPARDKGQELLLKTNIDLAEECELRLQQAKTEHQYCRDRLETANKLMTNLEVHAEIAMQHQLYQQEILDAQPLPKKTK